MYIHIRIHIEGERERGALTVTSMFKHNMLKSVIAKECSSFCVGLCITLSAEMATWSVWRT